jgi:hypothetical protein
MDPASLGILALTAGAGVAGNAMSGGKGNKKYTPPSMSTINMPWGSFGKGGYTETDQYKGIRNTGEDRRLQILADLGITLPERIAQSNEWRNMYSKHVGEPASRKLQQQMQRRGMTGTHMATGLSDLWGNVGKEAFLQAEGLRQGEEQLKLGRLGGMNQMLESIYGLGFRTGDLALNKYALDSGNAYKAWAGNRAVDQAKNNAWMTGLTGMASAAPYMMNMGGGGNNPTDIMSLFQGRTRAPMMVGGVGYNPPTKSQLLRLGGR